MPKVVEDVLSDVLSRRLIGQLLTIIDASFGDKNQREAVKSLVRQSCQSALSELKVRLEIKVERKE